jgi:hypothetical protein
VGANKLEGSTVKLPKPFLIMKQLKKTDEEEGGAMDGKYTAMRLPH